MLLAGPQVEVSPLPPKLLQLGARWLTMIQLYRNRCKPTDVQPKTSQGTCDASFTIKCIKVLKLAIAAKWKETSELSGEAAPHQKVSTI